MTNTHLAADGNGVAPSERAVKRRARQPNRAKVDPEAHAIGLCSQAVEGLDPSAVGRVLDYVGNRFVRGKI